MQQVWGRPSVSCKGRSPAQPWLLFGTVEHGCEYGETLFLLGSLNCKDFVKHLIFGLIQHLAPLVPQSNTEWQLGKAIPS